MAGPTPAGFVASDVISGLHLAMAFGAPSVAEQQATFYKEPVLDTSGTTDDEGIPFDPDVDVDRTPVHVRVPCAVEYVDVADQVENFGIRQPSKVKITILGPDWDQIVGDDDPDEGAPFSYVQISGQKYLYRKQEPVVALGTIDVHTVHCQSEDEL